MNIYVGDFRKSTKKGEMQISMGDWFSITWQAYKNGLSMWFDWYDDVKYNFSMTENGKSFYFTPEWAQCNLCVNYYWW